MARHSHEGGARAEGRLAAEEPSSRVLVPQLEEEVLLSGNRAMTTIVAVTSASNTSSPS